MRRIEGTTTEASRRNWRRGIAVTMATACLLSMSMMSSPAYAEDGTDNTPASNAETTTSQQNATDNGTAVNESDETSAVQSDAKSSDDPNATSTDSSATHSDRGETNPAEASVDQSDATNDTNNADSTNPAGNTDTADGMVAREIDTDNKADAITQLAQDNKGTIPDGVYGFASALAGGRLLEIADGSSRNGGNAQTYHNNRTSAQRWQVTSDDNGFLTLKNMRSGKVLDVAGASTKNGTNVQQYAANGTRAQQWIAVKNDDGIVLHSALRTDLVLDVAGASTQDRANVQIYRANGTKAQSWSLETSAYVRGVIETYWYRNRWLGNPKADEQTDNNGTGVTQEFANGTVYSKDGAGTHAIRGAIGQAYSQQGGYPIIGWVTRPHSSVWRRTVPCSGSNTVRSRGTTTAGSSSPRVISTTIGPHRAARPAG